VKTSSHDSQYPEISIIIPAVNEANFIGETLDAVTKLIGRIEIIVVDGESDDDTSTIARLRGAKVITSARGRGLQMHKGACAARGWVLWFLHADTIVPAGAPELILEALHDAHVVVGNFNVRFDGPGMTARFMTWLYPNLRKLGLSYGDSAIFVRREAYEQVGGFKAFPIFEDLDLLRELRKLGRMVHVPAMVVTSSRRFQDRGFAFTFVKWMIMQALYWLGFEPRTLGRFYAPVRDIQ